MSLKMFHTDRIIINLSLSLIAKRVLNIRVVKIIIL